VTRALVAGATGYLGRFLVKTLHEQGHWVRALSRSEEKLSEIRSAIDEVFIGEVTKPETLRGVAENVSVVISAIGVTRQKDGFTYQEVDYQGNVNLLKEALTSGVGEFIYVSALIAKGMQDLKIVQAKEGFVEVLRESGVDYAVIRPNGYFSDMREFLKMARRGRILLFGRGEYRINPIHGKDVAEVCVSAIDGAEREISFGGPRIYTHRDIAEAAFRALGKEPKISYIPDFVAKIVISLARLLTSSKFYGSIEFLLTVLTRDMIGERRGKELLTDFFQEEARLAPFLRQ
jgi:uncharacterized protein YbjT (DUF2867 family)